MSELGIWVGWRHLYQTGLKRLRMSQSSVLSIFPLLPTLRWPPLPRCPYHSQYSLENLSGLGSAFHMCCCFSPHKPLGAPATCLQIPTDTTPAQPQSRHIIVPTPRSGSSTRALGRALPCSSLVSRGQISEWSATEREIKKTWIYLAFWHTLRTMWHSPIYGALQPIYKRAASSPIKLKYYATQPKDTWI